jgi:hypothetical protein
MVNDPVISDTNTGTELLMVELFPNWPAPLLPQHLTVASAINAHEWMVPDVSPTADKSGESPLMPETETGTKLLVVEPLPNCPSWL